jgi:DNA-directed RNA polymerase specialized sigma24 family protein
MERRGRFYAIPAPERDRMIIQLRRAGWTHARIGRRVGMSESGVRRALERIKAGYFGEGMTRA